MDVHAAGPDAAPTIVSPAVIASNVTSGTPFTFAAWVKPESVGVTGTVFAVATSGSANHHCRVDIASSNVVRVRTRDTAASDALTTDTVSG